MLKGCLFQDFFCDTKKSYANFSIFVYEMNFFYFIICCCFRKTKSSVFLLRMSDKQPKKNQRKILCKCKDKDKTKV